VSTNKGGRKPPGKKIWKNKAWASLKTYKGNLGLGDSAQHSSGGPRKEKPRFGATEENHTEVLW